MNNIYGMLAIVIPSVLVFIGTTINGILSIRNNKHIDSVDKKVDIVTEKQEIQHLKTNSRLDELIAAIKISSHAAGVIEGIKQEQDRIILQLKNATEERDE